MFFYFFWGRTIVKDLFNRRIDIVWRQRQRRNSYFLRPLCLITFEKQPKSFNFQDRVGILSEIRLSEVAEQVKNGEWSSRQGRNPAGESPAVPIARFRHVVMPHPGMGNHPGYAWCKRLGRPAHLDVQWWVQPAGLASMGA